MAVAVQLLHTKICDLKSCIMGVLAGLNICFDILLVENAEYGLIS
jgi:hypothetical protein